MGLIMDKSIKKNTSNNYDKTYFDWQIDLVNLVELQTHFI